MVVGNTICYQVWETFLIECLGNYFKQVIISSITKEAFRNSKYMKMILIILIKFLNFVKFNLYGNNDILIERNKNVKKNFMFY